MATLAELEQRVLILAPIGRDARAVAQYLEQSEIASLICADVDDLCARLDEGAGLCLLTEEALANGRAQRLEQWAKRQPPWSDLPFVILTAHQSSAGVRAYRLGLIETLGNVSLIERPVSVLTLVSSVRTGLRSRARQYEVRHHLRERDNVAARLDRLVRERTGELEEANRHLRQEIKERQEAESALQQAQKMEVIGQMTGGVAHDFNNLLTAVMGNLEMAIRRNRDEALRRFLEGALEGAKRGARLTSQLLAFARRQVLRTEPVDFNALVSRLENLLVQSTGSKVRIETALQEGLWPAMADPHQIELVLLNLAVNARDAMPEGGLIRISTANVDRDDRSKPADMLGAEQVALAVSDTGVGMTEEIMTKVFDPFFTTKPIGKGTGLGLSQVYGIIKQLNGAVRINSAPGHGTTFTLYLPRAERAPTVLASSTAIADPKRFAAKVLVVDDDPEVREFVVSGLDSLGYETFSSDGGHAAIEFAGGKTPIDLLLIDIVMPEISGWEVSRRILNTRPDLPVLYMSGYPAPSRPDYAEQHDILQKPFTVAELATRVERALNGSYSARST